MVNLYLGENSGHVNFQKNFFTRSKCLKKQSIIIQIKLYVLLLLLLSDCVIWLYKNTNSMISRTYFIIIKI